MSRTVARPDDLDLDTPGRRDYWVALEHDTMWGTQLIPLTVLVGPKAEHGRGLVAFGSTHGNEYEGPTAIKIVMREIDVNQVDGRIILIPVLNPGGLPDRDARQRGGRRRQPEPRVRRWGRARSPPWRGSRTASPTSCERWIWPQVHVVLDLHSGGQQIRFDLCASFHPIDDPRQAAETRRNGAMVRHAADHDLPEPDARPAHERGRAARQDHGRHRAGLGRSRQLRRRALRPPRGARRRDPSRPASRRDPPIGHHAAGTQKCAAIVDFDCYVPAPFDGHYEEVIRCGSRVRRGDLVGRLHDFQRIDEPAWPVTRAEGRDRGRPGVGGAGASGTIHRVRWGSTAVVIDNIDLASINRSGPS